MNRYTIHCTQEQTKKALELGAQIKRFRRSILAAKDYELYKTELDWFYIPTAEQMIGWLEEHAEIDEVAVFKIFQTGKTVWAFDLYGKDRDYLCESDGLFSSRLSATLTAIDAALDYLIITKG